LKEEFMNVAFVLSALSTLAWLLALVVIGLAIMRAARGNPFRAATALIIGTIVVALLLTTVSAGLVFVQPTERGVVITALGEGIRPDALEPGLNWVVPFLENADHAPDLHHVDRARRGGYTR
jgi:regulator of protease activity HflC (stomatin/prohibitin superfamily)